MDSCADGGPAFTIGDHAIIGDCRTAALIARDGTIDWLCMPDFASPGIFSSLLDPAAGNFILRPRGAFHCTREYLDAPILTTGFETPQGYAVLTDAMTVMDGIHPMRPLRELIRTVEGKAGTVAFQLSIAPKPDYARGDLRIENRGALGWFCSWANNLIIIRSDIPLSQQGCSLTAEYEVRAGDRFHISLSFTRDDIAVLPLLGEQAQERLRLTKQWWREWNGRSTYSGPYRDMVQRSATVLQLLSYCLSGAIVAAPTTSLPESLGADRNWDYRYCWLRDAGMTAGALTGLGYHAEARAFVSWLLHATRLSWPELRIDYDVYGRERQHEEELSHLTGYRNSRPVRIGNAAGRQLQLDVYGETVIAADIVASAGMRLDPVEGRMLKGLGLSVCRQWQCPDNGIWEIRSAPRHYTLSKAMCWAALDRLISMDDRGLLVLGRYKKQFEATRDSIRQAIEKRSFNRALQHYTSEFEGDQVDASLLLLPRIGYIDAGNARMRATFRRIQDDLGTGSLLRRYQTGYDGSKTVEGAFVICNFWAVDNLALSGQVEEAARLFETILDYANDLGLFAEEIDIESGKALGNFPQAFSHVGLINAALTLQKCGWR